MAYVAVDADAHSCGDLCEGDANLRLLNTSNKRRFVLRTSKGFHHVLKPLGCRIRLRGEAEVMKCLAGRSVLIMGSAAAADVKVGFARLNESLVAWTRRRPTFALGTSQKKVPQASDFHFLFERAMPIAPRNIRNSMTKELWPHRKPSFGRASIETMFIHHPAMYGLANVVEPQSVGTVVRDAEGKAHERRIGLNHFEEYERFMCKHDIVLFESGVHDFGLPFRGVFKGYLANDLCASSSDAECRTVLAPEIQNETWRLSPFASYQARLQVLMASWRRCRATKPHFRPFFKLAPAPRSRLSCDRNSQWSFASASPQHLVKANRIARTVVENAGFEVFDAFGVTLHALGKWFDGNNDHRAEVTSDTVTQMFLSQLCGSREAVVGHVNDAGR